MTVSHAQSAPMTLIHILGLTSSLFISSGFAISPLEEIILELSDNKLNDNNGALLSSPLLQRLDEEDQRIVQNVDSYLSDLLISSSDPRQSISLSSKKNRTKRSVPSLAQDEFQRFRVTGFSQSAVMEGTTQRQVIVK